MCLAVPGKLLDIQGDDPLERCGRVSFGGVVKEVSLACAPEARPGDYVLVHVGVAIGVIDAEEAEETFRYLRAMGDIEGIEPEAPDPAHPT
jgi:hydrogenase expression/formation protein HypC